MNPLSARKQGAIHRNLAYWQRKLAQSNGHLLPNMNDELPGVTRAVDEGLLLPPAHLEAARLLHLMHRPAERLGWWEQWLELCQRALPLCPPQERALRAELLNDQGVMLRRCGRWPEAVASHQEAAQLATGRDDNLLAAQAHYFLGQALDQGQKPKEAATYAQQALVTFAEEAPGSSWHAAALTLRGDLARKAGDLETAVTLLQQAAGLYRHFQDKKTELALVLNNLALAHQKQKAWPAAATCYEEALGHLESTDSELTKSTVRCNYGVLLFEQKDYLRAELAFREADTVALRQSTDLFLRGSLTQNLGNTLLKQGNYLEAKTHLERSAVLWQRLGDDYDYFLANSWGTSAEAYAGRGEKVEAITLYNQALALLEQPRFVNWPPAQRLAAEFRRQRDELLEEESG